MVTMQDAIRLATMVRRELARVSAAIGTDLEELDLDDLNEAAETFLRDAGEIE